MDLTLLYNFFDKPANEQLYIFLINFGWIPIAGAIMWGAKEIWLEYINNKWGAQFDKVCLAIDIPKGVDQSLRSMENLFVYLGGAHGTLNLIDIYWEGKYQLSFAFEIVSIEGYIQYIIRTPTIYRNLVESAVYSQYPDAEITEVEDYTKDFPTQYPNDTWDLWGGEFIQVKPEAYPIPTYKIFESVLSGKPETQFKDPMASLMDCFSSLGPGEHAWYQICVKPTDVFYLVKPAQEAISKILKEKTKPKANIIDHFTQFLIDIMSEFSEIVYPFGIADQKKDDAKDDALKMMNLKPLEKKQVEAIQEKSAKVPFLCKIRYIYIAKKEVINKPKGAGGFVGFIKQFVDNDINNLKPDMAVTVTTANYFFVKQRVEWKKRKLMIGYKDRDTTRGRSVEAYNAEELATLWHFPVEAVVKAPLIQKAPGRKAEAPMSLPFAEKNVDESTMYDEDIFADVDNEMETGIKNKDQKEKKEFEHQETAKIKEADKDDIFKMADKEAASEAERSKADKKGAAPGNLPFIE